MSASRRQFLTATLGASAGVAFAGTGLSQTAKAAFHPIGDEGVGPAEDLMREHGVLNRILLIYDEGIHRIRAHGTLAPDPLQSAAGIIKRFLEDYHEKLEEDHLFPRFERAKKLTDLVTTLRAQHLAGRKITGEVLALTTATGFSTDKNRIRVADQLAQFVRMYRPHEAREDTILFPAFRDLVSKKEYFHLGESFEAKETKVLGERGFERIVEEVAAIERDLGIHDLNAFTPKP